MIITMAVLKGTLALAHIALGVNPSAHFTSKFRSDDLQNIVRIALVSVPAHLTSYLFVFLDPLTFPVS